MPAASTLTLHTLVAGHWSLGNGVGMGHHPEWMSDFIGNRPVGIQEDHRSCELVIIYHTVKVAVVSLSHELMTHNRHLHVPSGLLYYVPKY